MAKAFSRDAPNTNAVVGKGEQETVEFSGYTPELLRKDRYLVLYWGHPNEGNAPSILLLTTLSAYPTPRALNKIGHEYSLKNELDTTPAARPMTLFHMVRDARPAADIIDHVRLFYQKGSSKLDLVDVPELLERWSNVTQRGESPFRCHHYRCRQGLPKVKADRVQLQQALMNLMLNGIEAMRDISSELRIKAQRADDGQLLISSPTEAWDCPLKILTRFSTHS